MIKLEIEEQNMKSIRAWWLRMHNFVTAGRKKKVFDTTVYMFCFFITVKSAFGIIFALSSLKKKFAVTRIAFS